MKTLITLHGFLTEEQWSAQTGIALTDKPQVFTQLSREHYDLLPGISQSVLKEGYGKTPAHCEQALIKEEEEEKRKEFIIGNIAHCASLEDEELDQRYVATPEGAPSRPTEKQLEPPKPKRNGEISKETEAYKKYEEAQQNLKWWQEFDALHQGKEIVSSKDLAYGIALADALRDHPVIGTYLTGDQRFGNEITLTYIDSLTGLRIKVRLDMLRILGGIKPWIGDVKTTQDAGYGPDHFGKSVVNCGYIFQAAFYRDAVYHCSRAIEVVFGLAEGALMWGVNDIEYEWICIEKVKRPHYKFISRQFCPEELIDLGRQEYRKELTILHDSMLSGYFAGYNTEAVPLRIPNWGYSKMINGLEDG